MVFLTTIPTFGYETNKAFYPKGDWKERNKQKILGVFLACVPLLNFIGAAIIIHEARQFTSSKKVELITRAILTALCSPVILLIDCVVTAILSIKRKSLPLVNPPVLPL